MLVRPHDRRINGMFLVGGRPERSSVTRGRVMPSSSVILRRAMALGAIDGTGPVRVWLAQGGVATLESYGNVSPAELPRAHVDWMRALRLSYDDGRRFFVHAGVDPRKPLAEQEAVDMLWIREPFLSDTRGYGRLVVHGHTPMMTGAPDLRGNRLNLDTGAVFGGPLSAAAFDDTQTAPLAFLQAT